VDVNTASSDAGFAWFVVGDVVQALEASQLYPERGTRSIAERRASYRQLNAAIHRVGLTQARSSPGAIAFL
jgi:hypothetical protein